MGYTNNGLKNEGSTAHYQFQYDEVFASTGVEPVRTNALIDACEGDYTIMSNWFGGITIETPLNLPILVQVADESGGGEWSGNIVKLKTKDASVDTLRDVLVAEVTEMFMKQQDEGWFASDGSNEQSSGEGLSIFLRQQFQLLNGRPVEGPFNGNLWLNSALGPNVTGSTRINAAGFNYGDRADYVNVTLEHDHSNNPASGCSILFIYYLYVQLGFPIYRIVCAAAPTLAGVYKNLTGDEADPFPAFRDMLNEVYRYDFVARIVDGDNTFPITTSRILSTRKLAASLPLDQHHTSVHSLLADMEMPTLRAALNRRRRVSLM